ncbi:hypothetical protein K490DRAFT_54250 [Saccharata proteae CBS 121410]|uniref:Uncharacterized protein n=1 Tax=Saccharata proteae CBS 121410 TaxID=1314787 RepID=A0A9P4HVB8_9PEZI|nr:hypothetical protein K490DRAFT_54250 [Saccharata proteae CBS 121410]
MAPRRRPPTSSSARPRAEQHAQPTTPHRHNRAHLARNPNLNGTSDISTTPTPILLIRPLYPTTGARSLGKRVLELLVESLGAGARLEDEVLLKRTYIVKGNDAVQALSLLQTLDPADLTVGSERVSFDFAVRECLVQAPQTQTEDVEDGDAEGEGGDAIRWEYRGGNRDSYISVYTFPVPEGAERRAERAAPQGAESQADEKRPELEDTEGDSVMQEEELEDPVVIGSAASETEKATLKDSMMREGKSLKTGSAAPEGKNVGHKDAEGDTVMQEGHLAVNGSGAPATSARKEKGQTEKPKPMAAPTRRRSQFRLNRLNRLTRLPRLSSLSHWSGTRLRRPSSPRADRLGRIGLERDSMLSLKLYLKFSLKLSPKFTLEI